MEYDFFEEEETRAEKYAWQHGYRNWDEYEEDKEEEEEKDEYTYADLGYNWW